MVAGALIYGQSTVLTEPEDSGTLSFRSIFSRWQKVCLTVFYRLVLGWTHQGMDYSRNRGLEALYSEKDFDHQVDDSYCGKSCNSGRSCRDNDAVREVICD